MQSHKAFGFTVAIVLTFAVCLLAAPPSKPDPEFLDVQENFATGEDRVLQIASSKFRMVGNYVNLADVSATYQAYIQNELGPAILDYFQAALKVKYPITSTLSLSKGTKSICGLNTPSELFSGVAADFYVFFDGEYDTTSNWVASSYACYLATGSKRPLIAKTTFNAALLVPSKGDVLLHEKNVYLLLHEMTHNLGFTSSMYKYFLDENGVTRKGHLKTAPLDGDNSTVLDVPPLTDRLRTFFGCPTLQGAFLEDSGSSATAGDHFERRHFVLEAMTSGLMYGLKYSQFSLAVLEGSGWYVPDYSFADAYFYGQGQGCDFLFANATYVNKQYDEFCTGSSRGCTAQGRGGGFCQSDVRSNDCRFYYPNNNYDCEDSDDQDNARLSQAEVYGRGLNSKCFTGTLTTAKSASSTTFCFKYNCTGSGINTVLNIQVGTKSAVCKQAGKVSVSGYNGQIDCPDPISYCATIGAPACSKGCLGRGKCVKGVCVCNDGFAGTDCGVYTK